jgi:hypothetical protein
MFEKSRRVVLGAALAAPVVSASIPADAAPQQPSHPPPVMDQCVTWKLSDAEIARGVTNTVTCYPTLEAAMGSLGITDPNAFGAPVRPGRSVRPAAADQANTTTQALLARHYRDPGAASGPSITVPGDNCDGGGLSFSPGSQYDNWVSSTVNGICSKVKHYSGYNYDPEPGEVTVPGKVDLSPAMRGQVSSIKYLN